MQYVATHLIDFLIVFPLSPAPSGLRLIKTESWSRQAFKWVKSATTEVRNVCFLFSLRILNFENIELLIVKKVQQKYILWTYYVQWQPFNVLTVAE